MPKTLYCDTPQLRPISPRLRKTPGSLRKDEVRRESPPSPCRGANGSWGLAKACGRGELSHRLGLWPLGTRDHLKLDALALGQGTEARALNARVVREHIAALVLRDKAVTLLIVKPFDGSSCQGLILLTGVVIRNTVSQRMPGGAIKNRKRHWFGRCGPLNLTTVLHCSPGHHQRSQCTTLAEVVNSWQASSQVGIEAVLIRL